MTTKKTLHGWDKDHWQYHCMGCKDPHPSYWKTVIESKEWDKWYKEQMKRMGECECFDGEGKECKCETFDIDESMACNAISPDHFAAFCKFVKSLP